MTEWFVAFRANVVKFRIGDMNAKAQFIKVVEQENKVEVKVLEVYSGHGEINVDQVLKIPYESIYEADGKAIPPLG